VRQPLKTSQAIYAMISPNIQPVGDLGMYGIPCADIAGLPAQIDITFTDTSGSPFNLTIPTAELNVGPIAGSSTMCQTLINAYDGLNLVGGSLLKHWFSVSARCASGNMTAGPDMSYDRCGTLARVQWALRPPHEQISAWFSGHVRIVY
jgi:hypothetical protein